MSVEGAHYAQWLKQAGRGNMTIPQLFDAAAALQKQGQPQQAIALYRCWIEHGARQPLAYAAWFNLGALLAADSDDAGAEAAYRKCIALHPRFVEGRLNLGTLLERQGQPEEALAMWRTILGPAVKIDQKASRTQYLQTLNNLGRLLEIQKQYPEAEAMLAQSLVVEQDQPHVMTHWVHLRQKQCHWPTWSGLPHISRKQMEDGASALAMLSLTDDPALQSAAAARFVAEKIDTSVASLTGPAGQGSSYRPMEGAAPVRVGEVWLRTRLEQQPRFLHQPHLRQTDQRTHPRFVARIGQRARGEQQPQIAESLRLSSQQQGRVELGVGRIRVFARAQQHL